MELAEHKWPEQAQPISTNKFSGLKSRDLCDLWLRLPLRNPDNAQFGTQDNALLH